LLEFRQDRNRPCIQRFNVRASTPYTQSSPYPPSCFYLTQRSGKTDLPIASSAIFSYLEQRNRSIFPATHRKENCIAFFFFWGPPNLPVFNCCHTPHHKTLWGSGATKPPCFGGGVYCLCRPVLQYAYPVPTVFSPRLLPFKTR